MPPPSPQACQALAAQVASLEATDQGLRAQLPTLTGAAAWAGLAQLGQGRIDLARAQAQLDACIKANSAALQGQLVMIDLGQPTLNPPTRVASLWSMIQVAPSRADSTPLQANSFAFGGPLPPTLGISIATTGDPDVVGPDFRSGPIPAASLADGTVRIEVVLGPVIRIEQADLDRVAAEFVPTSRHLDVGGLSVDVSVASVAASLASGGIVGRLSGQAVFSSPVFGSSGGAFVGTATIGLVPSAALGIDDLCDLVTINGTAIELAGILAPVGAAVSAMSPLLDGLLTDQLRPFVRAMLPTAVTNALVLPSLPPGVTTSIRNVTITPDAIAFQPALGAIGTILSSFVPPPIPAP